MSINKSIQEKIWILGIVLLICGVLTLNNIFFISTVVQNVYYAIFFILSIITLAIIRKQYSFYFHHGFFIVFNLVLMYVTFLNHFIALPLLLIFPAFCSKKSHWIFKCFSYLSYILLLLFMFLMLFVRLMFTSTTLIKTVDSPNKKQMIEVFSIDEGALGGSTDVKIADKYFYIFKKNRLIYYGGYGEAKDITWIDSSHVKIDGKIIDITSS